MSLQWTFKIVNLSIGHLTMDIIVVIRSQKWEVIKILFYQIQKIQLTQAEIQLC